MKMVQRKQKTRIRHRRLRRKVTGTAARPRLCVMVSNKHIHVQIVDDERAATLAAATTAGKAAIVKGKNVAAATALGRQVAELARAKGVKAVVFDRGGFKYHGRIKAIAEAIREAGITC